MKILVADDDPSARCLMKNLISSWGFDVVLASDGNEAVKILLESDPPQIAILDWSMPGKTGVEICSICEKEGLSVYRILVTAKDEEQDFIKAIDSGAHDFQSKPIVPGILKSRITVGQRSYEWVQEVIRSERLAAVGRLVAGMSHHFNNLNTPILMYTSSLLKRKDLQDDVRSKIEKIERAAEQAKDLTERLMAFASNKKIKMKKVNLNDIVTETIELESIVINKMGIELKVHLSPLPEVSVYEGDIRHAVMNLIKNACDSMIDREIKILTLKTGTDNGEIYLSVSDTGCGIESDKLTKIFSLFYTEKGEFAKAGSPLNHVKGRGLGLYACKKIAAKHCGNITVKSQVDKGSDFTLWLPVSQNYSESHTGDESA